MARRAPRIDAVQPEIVEALRRIGCSVQSLAAVGEGCPDLLVGVAGVNFLVELKRPGPYAFTGAQKTWHQEWRGRAHVCRSIDDALAVAAFYRRVGAKLLALTLEAA